MPSLLIAGGLTIDRFADGATAPGGSVLHAGRAALDEGVRPVFLTVSGDEPEARAGIAALAEMGDLYRGHAAATTCYAHREVEGRRVLAYESAGGRIAVDVLDGTVGDSVAVDAVLLAPIADELSPATVAELERTVRPRLTVLLIQGWLRRLALGKPVRPLPLADVDPVTWACFAAADAIVVSTEDLADAPRDPFAQAADLRARLGRGPLLVLTLGAHGYLLDDPVADSVIASVPRRIVEGVPTVGAGDTFGVALAVHLAAGRPLVEAASGAAERVIAVLEARRS